MHAFRPSRLIPGASSTRGLNVSWPILVIPLIPLWWGVAGLLFGIALICCAYAFQGGHWWLWLGMLAPLGVVGMMAARAVERADRKRARAAELARLQDAWLDHLQRWPTL